MNKRCGSGLYVKSDNSCLYNKSLLTGQHIVLCYHPSQGGYLLCHRIQGNAVGTADMPLASIVFPWTKDKYATRSHGK